jgi:hypothetical protein
MRKPGPEKANSLRQNEAVTGTTTLRWISGSEACREFRRQPDSGVEVFEFFPGKFILFAA